GNIGCADAADKYRGARRLHGYGEAGRLRLKIVDGTYAAGRQFVLGESTDGDGHVLQVFGATGRGYDNLLYLKTLGKHCSGRYKGGGDAGKHHLFHACVHAASLLKSYVVCDWPRIPVARF